MLYGPNVGRQGAAGRLFHEIGQYSGIRDELSEKNLLESWPNLRNRPTVRESG